MRGPAYEPSPQVKPVVLSPFGIKHSGRMTHTESTPYPIYGG
jgi:hypothetical protein